MYGHVVLPMPLDHIVWLSQTNRSDESTVGAKAADLGEMTKLRLPVPHGFVIETTAYYSFLQTSGLRTKLETLFTPQILADPKKRQAAAKQAHSMLIKASLPETMLKSLTDAYHHLSSKDVYVAVRASVPDSQSHINLGQTAILNILGGKAIAQAVQQMWASLYSTANLQHCYDQNVSPLQLGMAIIIQRMLEPESAGILFSQDPISQNPNLISIEAAWGLGEPVMSGQIVPDHYEVDRQSWTITRRDVVRQEWQLVRQPQKKTSNAEPNAKVPISAAWQRKPKLDDQQIVALSKLALKVEDHYGYAQDCEWAYADKQFYIVQTRPVLGLDLSEQPRSSTIGQDHQPISILAGLGAAPGLVSGPVRLVRSRQDVAKLKQGEIMVCQTTNPDYDPALAKAAAVIVATGSLASHASAMARQLAIPAIVEAGNAIDMLKNGELVTVDGQSGAVYAGQVHISGQDLVVTSAKAKTNKAVPESENAPILDEMEIKTATKIMVSLTEPSQAEEVATKPVDGVGLLRAEYMLADLGQHPQSLLQKHKGESLTNALYEGLMTVAKAFNGRPVVYRASNFTSREYSRLADGQNLEMAETNPMLGFRGASRYLAEPAVFKLELAAIRKARTYYKNICLLLPYVRTPEELTHVKQLLAEEGLYRNSSFKVYISLDVPANLLVLDQFLAIGIDGIFMDAAHLTEMILSIDLDSPRVAHLADERQEAVMLAMEQAIASAARHGISSSLYSQSMALYPESLTRLLDKGLSNLVVSPDTAGMSRRRIAEAELQVIRQRKS